MGKTNETRCLVHDGSVALLLELGAQGPAAAASEGKRMLLVDDYGPALAEAIRAAGAKVSRWRRFSRGDREGAAWPEPRGGGQLFDAAVVRLPSTKAALELALHAVAPLLAAGAPLWVYGACAEGAHTVKAALREPLFEKARLPACHGGYAVAVASRSSAERPVAALHGHRQRLTLQLEGQPVRWQVYTYIYIYREYIEYIESR